MASTLQAKVKEFEKQITQEQGDTLNRLPPGFDLDRVIGYQPRDLQEWLEQQERRFNVEVVHRRFGKTYAKVRKLLDRAMHCPFTMGRYAYVAPTYGQAEDIAWAYLLTFGQRIYAELGLDERKWVDRSRMAIWVPTFNGSPARIRLYGVDNQKERLRGLYLDGLVLDEYAQIPPSVWTEQIRPMLSDDTRQGHDAKGRRNQWADFIFTPKGRNHAYELWRKADAWARGNPVRELDPEEGTETEVFSEEWFAARLPASETNVLSRRELAAAQREMGRQRYEQEYEVSFDAALEGAIYAPEIKWLRWQGRVQHMPYNPLLPVHTGWDLGWDDATAIWFAQVQDNELRVIDYYEASGAPLQHFAQVLADRGYTYGKHFLPHDVEVHELGSGKSRASILREMGVRVNTVPKHGVPDRIAAVQATLPICRFNEARTMEGLDRLALYRREYDEKKGVFREQPLHDWTSHAADAFGTLVMGIQSRLKAGSGNASGQTHAEM